MAATALAVERPIRIDAIAGPAIDTVRLVDGVKAQKPNAARPQIRKCPLEDAHRGTQNRTPEPAIGPRRKRQVGPRKPKGNRTRATGTTLRRVQNPKSDIERNANSFDQAAISPRQAWDAGMKKSSGE